MHAVCLRTQAHILAKLGQIRELMVSTESGYHDKPLRAHNMTWACMLCACVHRPISWPNWVGSEIKIFLEHAGPLWVHILTQARKLACMHTMCLHVWANISAKLGWIRKMKVSMESGENTGPIWEHNVTQAHKLACMHAMCLHAQAHISAKLEWISEIKLSIE